MFGRKALSNLIEFQLRQIKMYSPEAVRLLLYTFAHESLLGQILVQRGGGPGRGIGQVEIPTMHDIYENYLAFRPGVKSLIEKSTCVRDPNEEDLAHNHLFNISMARIVYRRHPYPLPPANASVERLADYWQIGYNRGKVVRTDKFIENGLMLLG